MTTLAALYRETRVRLAEAGIDSAAFDARLLVESLTGSNPEDLVCRPLTEIAPDLAARVTAAVTRRLAGEPVHRILGWREFYGLKLSLSPETLEPRPDTETLVDAVLPFINARIAQTGACRILDLGTGTGAIPLALLSEARQATAVATDISQDALETAQHNAQALGLAGRFSGQRSNWFETITGVFDLIVSNPPYIASRVIPTLDAGVRHYDPMRALDGGDDGLDAYRAISAGASNHLTTGGLLALEIGFDQAESVTGLLVAAGFDVAPVIRDLNSNDRVLLAKFR